MSRQDAARFQATWSGSQEEYAERDYVISNDRFVETPGYRLPPILLQDVGKWASHSKIPIRDPDDESTFDEREAIDEEEIDEDPFDSGTSGMRREEEGASRFDRGASEEGSSSEDLEKVTEFKLFRYFDATVEPGKSYRYRVRLVLEDPNNPLNEMQKPTPRALEPAVAARIHNESVNLKEGQIKWYRFTDWSETSSVIRVPSAQSLLAGQVTSAGHARRGNITFTNPRREPSVKVLVLQFDKEKAADVPAEIELYRGSQANAVTDVEYLRPTEFDLEKLTGYNVQSDAIVLDMLGGDRIGGLDLTTPGEMLVLDSQGNLVMHNEMDDLQQYRWNSFEPKEQDDEYYSEPGEGRLRDDEEPGRGVRGGRERPNRRGNSRNRRGRGNDRDDVGDDGIPLSEKI